VRAPHRRSQDVAASSVALALVLVCAVDAFALNPTLDISQYAHTAWRTRDGFSKGTITDIAQTPDGYLWLGTELGMLRFDGVRPVPWQPPQGQQLPSSNIRSLLAAHDGALWIGTEAGLARWKEGTLTRSERLAGRHVGRLVEDREGSIWATTFFNREWTLCEIHGDHVECHGDNGEPGAGAISLHEDRAGQLWVGTAGRDNGLWRWRPGAPKFYPLPQQANGIRGLAEDADGALLISLDGGVRRFVDGETALAYPFSSSTRQFQFGFQLRDRDGSLWLGNTSGRGLVHSHSGMTDAFASSDGISGDSVRALFEDREGNIWVATIDGLDRFCDVPVATYSSKQGLSNGNITSVLASEDGSVWVGTADHLNRWTHGRVTIYQEPAGPGGVHSLFQDALGRVWGSTLRETGYLKNDQFVAVTALRGGRVRSLAEDRDASIWITNDDLGLYRVTTRTGQIDLTPWAALKSTTAASAMAADLSQRGVWLGFPHGGVAHFADDQVRATYGVAEGLSEGTVRSLRLDRDGSLWAATDVGLSWLKDGRFATLTSKNGLPCDAVQWSI